MKRTTPEVVTDAAFGQFITFVEANKLCPEVLRRLNKRLRKPARASDVHRWLHPEGWQRTEPRWGMGALLLAVWEEILTDLVQNRVEEGWRWVKNASDSIYYLVPSHWKRELHKNPEFRGTNWIPMPDAPNSGRIPFWIATEP